MHSVVLLTEPHRYLDRRVVLREAGRIALAEDEYTVIAHGSLGRGKLERRLERYEVLAHPVARRLGVVLRDGVAFPVNEHDRKRRLKVPFAARLAADRKRARDSGPGRG